MLDIKNLGYWYDRKEESLFKDINLNFEKGNLYAILGASGSGKTTFLSLIAGLDKQKEGEIIYDGTSLSKIGLTNYRNKNVSIVFQSYNLFNYMSALDNVLTAMAITGSKQANNRDYALKMLDEVGINENLAKKNVQKLSGGQQQRVAIVRAMCCDAKLVVADEPTGNLDEDNTLDIINLFKTLAHEQQKCVIVVTHEQEVADQCDHELLLKSHAFTQVK